MKSCLRYLCHSLIGVILVAGCGWNSFLHAAEGAEAAPAKPAGKMITLSDFGAEDLGYLVLPQTAPVGGVVILHDRYGLDTNAKKLAEEFAARGYLAIAVDLYNGRTTNDIAQANALLTNMRIESALNTIQGGVRLLKESPRLKVDRVGLVGYSSGGTIALLASQQIKSIDAVGVLNGMIAPRNKKISKFRVPICLILPQSKDGITTPGLDEFKTLMEQMKNPLELQFLQPTGEGFADPRNSAYNADMAAKGWQFIDDFLKRELGKPAKEPSLIDKVEDFFR